MNSPKLSAELARVTEAAAVAVHAHLGSGALEQVDQAAVDAMRQALSLAPFYGCIAIGEGEKDCAPMLRNGEMVGISEGFPVDLAVDPVDGTRAAAMGTPGSVSALAATPAGRMFRPGSVAYMEKIVGPPGVDLHLEMTTEDLLAAVSRAQGVSRAQLRVAILDRPRNALRMKEVRAAGAQVVALPYADLSACVAVATGEADIHLLTGIGGCAEGVIAAVAASALGAPMQCRLWPRNEGERAEAEEAGLSCTEVLDAKEMVGAKNISVVLTGVTGNMLVDPIRAEGRLLEVHSVRIDSGEPPMFTRNALATRC